VKGAVIEPGAERVLRFVPQPLDRQHPDLVAGRLTGTDDVAADFRADGRLGLRRVGEKIVDGLRLAPAFRVQPGIDHQPNRAPDFTRQPSEV
jgi:hypothetical protein